MVRRHLFTNAYYIRLKFPIILVTNRTFVLQIYIRSLAYDWFVQKFPELFELRANGASKNGKIHIQVHCRESTKTIVFREIYITQ